jgi:hypothetical protein
MTKKRQIVRINIEDERICLKSLLKAQHSFFNESKRAGVLQQQKWRLNGLCEKLMHQER